MANSLITSSECAYSALKDEIRKKLVEATNMQSLNLKNLPNQNNVYRIQLYKIRH